jgi:signal peptide peptidase SppA
MADRYARIITLVQDMPWAILPAKLAAIKSLLQLRSAGLTLTAEDVRARLGGDPPTRQDPRINGAGVAVLPVFGVIAQRMDLFAEMSGGTSTETLARDFRTFRDNAQVKAIVLAVDSPGGGVYGIDELATEIRAARGLKPIVAVADSVAASAAYWLASQADELIVTPGGQVGSIGVFTAHDDVSKMLDELGVTTTLISAGKYKVEANPFEPLSKDAKAALQATVDQYYARFLQAVAAGRHVSAAAVEAGYGQGRMLTSADALAAGMVDRIDTLDATIARLSAVAAASALSSLHATGTAQEPVRVTAQDRRRQSQQLALAGALLDL